MKTSKITLTLFTILLVVGLFFSSCSKDRIEPPQEQTLNSYQSINSYYDTKKQDEQEFTIDTSGTAPIVGHEGTKIWPSKDDLMFANGDSVFWPFTLKLIELYPVKDMIYYQMPTLGGGNLLTSYGEVKITAYKNGQELVLRPGRTWLIEMPNSTPQANMEIYYGTESNSIVDWANNPAGVFSSSSYGYLGNIKVLGWVSCAIDSAFSSGTTTYTFSSTTDDLQNVSKFIYLPNFKALMQVYSNVSGNLPVGENIEIIFIGINSSNELFYYNSSTTVNPSTNTVNVTLTQITDSDLTTILDNL